MKVLHTGFMLKTDFEVLIEAQNQIFFAWFCQFEYFSHVENSKISVINSQQSE